MTVNDTPVTDPFAGAADQRRRNRETVATYLRMTEGEARLRRHELPAQRRASGVVTGGQALVAALLHAVLDAGVDVRTSARASRLGPGGVVVDGELIRGRVVLATGGYERDPGLSSAFLPVPPRGLIGAPGARGDGLRMAMAAGAELGNMADAWWCPTIEIPGDTIDGQPLHRILFAERSRPGTIPWPRPCGTSTPTPSAAPIRSSDGAPGSSTG